MVEVDVQTYLENEVAVIVPRFGFNSWRQRRPVSLGGKERSHHIAQVRRYWALWWRRDVVDDGKVEEAEVQQIEEYSARTGRKARMMFFGSIRNPREPRSTSL